MMLYVSTPCYGGICLSSFAKSMFKLQKLCSNVGVRVIFDTTENESLVHRARNVSAARFYQKYPNATHFLFIDADIHFDPHTIIRFIQADHEVTVASYPKKGIMWHKAEETARADSGRDLNRAASALVLNFKGSTTPIVNGFAEVLDGPTGCMMIKRSVFDKMFRAYPELTCNNDHMNRDLETYCAVFDCMIDPVDHRYLSEDYAFCRRWQKIGGAIYADVTATLGHIGNIRFNGILEDRLKAENS